MVSTVSLFNERAGFLWKIDGSFTSTLIPCFICPAEVASLNRGPQQRKIFIRRMQVIALSGMIDAIP